MTLPHAPALRRRLAVPVLAAGLAVCTAGCGSAAPAATDDMAMTTPGAAGMTMTTPQAGAATAVATRAAMAGHMHDPGQHAAVAFGEAGQAADSTRTIEIHGGDDLKWLPDKIDVALGETVTLRVSNDGTLPHDFLLGDAALQAEHGKEMAAMGGTMPDDDHHVTVQPGETKDIVWHFTQPGEVLYGCHIPGHYEAGMLGTVTVR